MEAAEINSALSENVSNSNIIQPELYKHSDSNEHFSLETCVKNNSSGLELEASFNEIPPEIPNEVNPSKQMEENFVLPPIEELKKDYNVNESVNNKSASEVVSDEQFVENDIFINEEVPQLTETNESAVSEIVFNNGTENVTENALQEQEPVYANDQSVKEQPDNSFEDNVRVQENFEETEQNFSENNAEIVHEENTEIVTEENTETIAEQKTEIAIEEVLETKVEMRELSQTREENVAEMETEGTSSQPSEDVNSQETPEESFENSAPAEIIEENSSEDFEEIPRQNDQNQSGETSEIIHLDLTDNTASETEQIETILIEETSVSATSENDKSEPIVIVPDDQEVAMETTEDQEVSSEEQTEVIIVQNVDDLIVMETEEIVHEENVQEVQIIEMQQEDEEIKKEDKPVDVKKLKIPHHVLGRNIENPVNDLFSNGRVPPKPRLGVKIPYRNLTSQIVSKQEIENVIMERARQKNSSNDPPAGGDVFFTKKLTQRLAKKIAPGEKKKEETSKKEKPKQATTIADANDLIAILEGDDEEENQPSSSLLRKKSQKTPEEEEIDREREKQIALKQLEQLPQRRRGRSAANTEKYGKKQELPKFSAQKNEKSTAVTPKKTPEEKPQEVEKPIEETEPVIPPEKSPETSKDNAKDDLDIEPRFVTTGVVKTYTRKRKPSEGVQALAKAVNVETEPKKPLKVASEQKISIDLPPNTYVTKSSRIIKKKIIWDPDETTLPFRSYKSPKVDTPAKSEKTVASQKTASAPKQTATPQKPPPTPQKVSATPQKPLPQKSTPSQKTATPQQKPSTAPQKSTPSPQKTATTSQKSAASQKPVPAQKSPEKKTPKDEKLQQKKIDKAQLLKKQKRLTEVDKLLMDEGAVNMLYEVKNSEDQAEIGKPKKRKLSTISLDKAQKDLQNKTNEIKNDLQNSSSKMSPKSLRKKENLPLPHKLLRRDFQQPGAILRKKSKDSNRSSVHSPPASPAYYPEASRIIRRHSSSSFSSDNEGENKVEKEKDETPQQPQKVGKKKTANVEQQKKKTRLNADKADLTSEEKTKLNEEMSKSFNKLVADTKEKPEKDEVKTKAADFKTLTIKDHGKLVQIIMHTTKKDAFVNVQVSC